MAVGPSRWHKPPAGRPVPQVKEPSLESLARGKKVYEPPRFMSVATAVQQLLEVEERRGEGAYGPDTLAVGVARVGSESQRIVAGPLAALADVDFGPPLHSLVIAGETHPIEQVGGERGARGLCTRRCPARCRAAPWDPWSAPLMVGRPGSPAPCSPALCQQPSPLSLLPLLRSTLSSSWWTRWGRRRHQQRQLGAAAWRCHSRAPVQWCSMTLH